MLIDSSVRQGVAGDRILIVKELTSHQRYKTGCILNVYKQAQDFLPDGSVWAYADADKHKRPYALILKEEYEVINWVTEKRKAKPGDLIIVTDPLSFLNYAISQEVYRILDVSDTDNNNEGLVYFHSKGFGLNIAMPHNEYEVIVKEGVKDGSS